MEPVQHIEYLHVEHMPMANEDHSIDIVFVHGLNPLSKPNFAIATWTHENKNYWPKAQLPKSIPSARILTFSYNSQVALGVSTNGIKNHANSLLDRLSGVRNRKPPKEPCTVPIIFVAHSLGGLVVKQALVNAKNNDKYKEIRDETYGLVFFAVPHQGGHGAALGTIAKNIIAALTGNSRNDLVESLRKNSLFQENQAEHFRHQLETYQLVSIFETLPTKIGFLGRSKIVVDEKSATLGLAGTRETILSVNANHSDICKFAGDDDKFDPIKRAIETLAKDAMEKEKEKQAKYVAANTSPVTKPSRMEEHVAPRQINPGAVSRFSSPLLGLMVRPVNLFTRVIYRTAGHYNTLQLGFYHAYFQIGMDLRLSGETMEARALGKRHLVHCQREFVPFNLLDGKRFSIDDLKASNFEEVLSEIRDYSQHFFAIIGSAGFMAYLSMEGSDKEKRFFNEKARTVLSYLDHMVFGEVKNTITILRSFAARNPQALANNIMRYQRTI